jgi:RNA polymerase sigma factor (sigma-70 family)
MPDQSDALLLREFIDRRSQTAFTELVSRHSDWVYSAALRMVRDPHTAEDVAQAVFLVLADKAAKLAGIPLHRWLFKVTRYAAANAIRARSRRDKHERRAAMSSSEIYQPDPDQMWREISPVLDDSLSRLRTQDRDALLLRFYQQKSVAEVGAALGVSEGAAKIRIVRAIEKLRGHLRRRGITVPAEALSAAMLTHATHAAPAIVASGSVSISASGNAMAISKGVSTMMLTAKIKIAALLIVIGAIPVGTGALLLADRSASAPPPVAAPVVSVPADTDQNVGIDPRVAPFVKSDTDILLTIDITKIDLDALAADMRTELTKSQLDAASTGRINAMIQMGLAMGRQWIGGFKQAGGASLYLVSQMNDLIAGNAAQGSSMSLVGTLVFPTDSPAAAGTLAKYLTRPGCSPPRVIDNTVVFDSSTPALPQFALLSDSRPALAKAIAAGGNAPLRAAINPRKLGELMTKLMGSGNIPMKFSADDWRGMEYASINVVLPPAQSPCLLVIDHYPDHASAQTAITRGKARIDQYMKSAADSKSPLTAKMLQFVGTEKFSVNDCDVEATLDLHAYWDLIFAAINSAPARGTPQSQQPINGM